MTSFVHILVPKYVILQISVCLTSQLVLLGQSHSAEKLSFLFSIREGYFVTIAFFVQVNQWKGHAMTLHWVF